MPSVGIKPSTSQSRCKCCTIRPIWCVYKRSCEHIFTFERKILGNTKIAVTFSIFDGFRFCKVLIRVPKCAQCNKIGNDKKHQKLFWIYVFSFEKHQNCYNFVNSWRILTLQSVDWGARERGMQMIWPWESYETAFCHTAWLHHAVKTVFLEGYGVLETAEVHKMI